MSDMTMTGFWRLMDLDDFEDEEEAAYGEAMKVIFKKHDGLM